MEIKVLGPGCPKCQKTEKIVKEAVTETGVDAVNGHVTDVMEIAGYAAIRPPSATSSRVKLFSIWAVAAGSTVFLPPKRWGTWAASSAST